ncbi:type I secretion system permease/ATPase [uncultured Roseobacter sp.]|uniref:type I secretion system permease/ATPase n=1 Tax=uncultured Roseobacter sp. TaxID=114847 RepID=UPI00261B815C|nr:type I secretion system permease/ATPase [uncultured Roseobacter sp.]
MQTSYVKIGLKELRRVRRRSRLLYWAVALFSLFANLLMLTGPLYMLQVYDRVLGSGSEETLIALSIIVVFMYGIMGLLDYTRGRIMGRVGARFQSDLDRRVFDAMIRQAVVAPDIKTQTSLADLEAVQRLMTSPVLMAAFDLPWTPFFFAGIFLFHPILGYFAVGGAVVLILIALTNQLLSREPQNSAVHAGQIATVISEQIRIESETVHAMGMRESTFERWQTARSQSLNGQVRTADITGIFTSLTKSLRLLLQSAMLGIGAWLVLHNEMTAGAMIAGSILLGRALAPVELALNQWQIAQRAFKGWGNLSELLGAVPEEKEKTLLPSPNAKLAVKSLSVVPPGEHRAILKSLTFEVNPGQAMGVIGPSGAGKSTLARALTGVWSPTAGSIRLDGATLEQYAASVLGQHIGYLPQRIQLFDGTIAENIARLAESPDPEKVVTAAKKAAAHQMILDLPNGYDTVISSGQSRLSGGQMQRIGLARALYCDPALVVLDEPNSNLDNEGGQALNSAIRAMKQNGSSVLIMAHRPAAIQECDTLLVLDNGTRLAFGPKDEVLACMVKNHKEIKRAPVNAGGVR